MAACILTLLTCFGFFLATAANKDNQSGTFTPAGSDTELFSWTYQNDVHDDGNYYPNFYLKVTDAAFAETVDNITAICQIWNSENRIVAEPAILAGAKLNDDLSTQGYCHIGVLEPGTYKSKLIVKFMTKSEGEKMYEFFTEPYTVTAVVVDPNQPSAKLDYEIVDGNKLNFNVTVENQGEREIEAINVWLEAGGQRNFQQTSTTAPFSGSITVELAEGAVATYYVKAEVLFSDGSKIGGNNGDNPKVQGTDQPKEFRGPVDTSKPSAELSYDIVDDKCNFTVAVANEKNHPISQIRVWLEGAGGNISDDRTTILKDFNGTYSGNFTGTVSANLNEGVSAQYWVKAEVTFENAAYNIGANMPGSDIQRTFIGGEKQPTTEYAHSEEGEYWAAIFEEGVPETWPYEGTPKYNYPPYADGLPENNLNGITGRYIKIIPVNGKGYYAPKVTYTIGNDAEGHIIGEVQFPTPLPTGFDAAFRINNNPTPFRITVDEATGKGTFNTGDIVYPNRTISYYLRANMADGGSMETRVFGYKVENSNAEIADNLESLAKKALNVDETLAAHIYWVEAHDSKTPVKEDEANEEGQWKFTSHPVDYANIADEEFYFSPKFQYIIANDAKEVTGDNTEAPLYIACEFEEGTVIPSNFEPFFQIYELPEEAATPERALKAEAKPLSGLLPLNQVRGVVNTYQAVTTDKFPTNKKLGVAFRFQYTSIIAGNGNSETNPRSYAVSNQGGTVTGIDNVSADNEDADLPVNVYNIQGMMVRRNVARSAALDNLPAGIYIVSGRKYIVR